MPDANNEITLRCYIERLMTAHEHWALEKFDALDKALVLAREEDARRFSLLNELRREVIEDRGQFVLREAWEAKDLITAVWREAILKQMGNAENRITALETRVSVWAAVLALMVILVQIVSHFIWR